MALIVALSVAIVVTPVAAALARRWDIVDRPGPLKIQHEPVPYLGGIALVAAVAPAVGVSRPAFLLPIGLAALLGLADDIRGLSAPLRLVAELAIGVVVATQVSPRGLPGAVATVLAVVVLVNAVNMLDGLDGLACGVTAVAALGFAVLLDGDQRVLALALAGGLVGVLFYNRPPARVYLGDAGSYAIGTTLALLVGSALGEHGDLPLAAASLVLVGVPLADSTIAIARRLRARRPLFEGDRGHVYDQLVDRGWPASAAVLSCIASQLVLAGIAVLLADASPATAVVGAGTIALMVSTVAWFVFTAPASWSR